VNENLNYFETIADLIRRVSALALENKISHQEIMDAFSESQVRSKNWLVEECTKNGLYLGIVFLCGGWFSTIVLHPDFKFEKLRSFDIDPHCKTVSEHLHRKLLIDNWKFLAVTANIHNVNFVNHTFEVIRKDGSSCSLTESPDTIINTSCEHIENFQDWYNKLPLNKLLILQSNNGFNMSGHLNCSNSIEDFAQSTPFSKEIFSGTKEMPQFQRYMRIGYK
jgi:hypothetical protein